jgi:predicted polyphosphate/ATP-dependent NAD kinase
MLTFGFIINPMAGIGGSVGLKGSDGADIVAEAMRRGAEKKSQQRAQIALSVIADLKDRVRFITCPGDMGEHVLSALGFEFSVIELAVSEPTTAQDTQRAAELMLNQPIDCLVFAGGDGTARDICAMVNEQLPVLGIPAGVKIHSGVYGVTPTASGEVMRQFIEGGLVDIAEAEVRDLDEAAFRQDQVRARHYGDMKVIRSGHFVQAVKEGGVEVEALVLADIADYIAGEMEDDTLYLIGSGKTTQAISEGIGVDNTLLGVDAVINHELVASDLSEQEILHWLDKVPQARAIVSVMGGQGHVFGRGNQQFSPKVLARLGKENFWVVSTKTKLVNLDGRPLIIDSGDPSLDRAWAGSIRVITGYQNEVIYPLA